MTSSPFSYPPIMQPYQAAWAQPHPYRASNPFFLQSPAAKQPSALSADQLVTTSQSGALQNSQKAVVPKKADQKPKLDWLGLAFPIMSFVGAPLMLGPSLLGLTEDKVLQKANPNTLLRRGLAAVGLDKKLLGAVAKDATEVVSKMVFEPSGLAKRLGLKKSAALEKGLTSAYNVGKNALAIGIVPKILVGLQYGLKAQQPSVLLAYLLQVPLVPLISMGNPIATTVNYLMGGLFTVGFINDVDKDYRTKGIKAPTDGKDRFFDMTRFKQIISPKSGLSLFTRLGGFMSETAKMGKFIVDDHLITAKRAFTGLKNLAQGKQNDFTDTNSASSITKSSLGVYLTYLATFPAILLSVLRTDSGSKTFLAEKLGVASAKKMLLEGAKDVGIAAKVSTFSSSVTAVSALALNFGMLQVALTGRNWAEKIPLIGTGAELGGTLLGYFPQSILKPLSVVLQQVGAGFNSIFYAAKAKAD